MRYREQDCRKPLNSSGVRAPVAAPGFGSGSVESARPGISPIQQLVVPHRFRLPYTPFVLVLWYLASKPPWCFHHLGRRRA